VTLVQGLRLLASSAFDKPPTPPTWLRDEVWTQLHSTQGWSNNLDFLYKYIEHAWMEKELLKRDPERIFLGVMTQQPIDRLMWTVVETFRDRNFVSQDSRSAAETWESFVRNDLQLNESMTDIFNVYKKYDDVDRAKRRNNDVEGFEHIHLSSLSLDLVDNKYGESALAFLSGDAGTAAAGGGTRIDNLPLNMKQLISYYAAETSEGSAIDSTLFESLDTILASFVYMSYGRFPRFITLMSMKKPSTSSAEIQASEVSYFAEPFGFPCSYDYNLDGRKPAWNHDSETTYVENLKMLQSIDSEFNQAPPLKMPDGMKQLRILNHDIAIGNVQMHAVDISPEEKSVEESTSTGTTTSAEFGSIFELYNHIKTVNWKGFSGTNFVKVAKKSMYIQYRKHNSEGNSKWETGRLSFDDLYDGFDSEYVTLTLYHTFSDTVGQDNDMVENRPLFQKPLFRVKSTPSDPKAAAKKHMASLNDFFGIVKDSTTKSLTATTDKDNHVIYTIFEEDEAVDQFTAFRQVPIDEMLGLLDSEVKTVMLSTFKSAN